MAALVQHVSSHEIAHGLTLEQGALVVSGIMFGAAIGKATIGILLDYLKPELTIVIYSAIGLAGWGLMAVATTPTPAIAAGFMAGLGQGVVLVALPWVIRKSFGQRDYSEILSIVSMFGAVASAIAVTAHGAVFDAAGSCTWSPRPAWSSDSVCARSRKSRSRPSEAGQNRFQTNVYIRNIRSIHE